MTPKKNKVQPNVIIICVNVSENQSFTFFSDTGATPPESCVFGFMSTITSFAGMTNNQPLSDLSLISSSYFRRTVNLPAAASGNSLLLSVCHNLLEIVQLLVNRKLLGFDM